MAFNIDLKKQFFESVLSGDKHVTIRPKKRNIPVGPAQINESNGLRDSLRVNITDVEYTTFAAITDEMAKAEGMESADQVRQVIQDIYANLPEDKGRIEQIPDDFPVTVAYWDPASVQEIPGLRPNA